MMIHLNKKRAQSTLEYAVLTVVVIGALIAIQTYVKRGVQGKLKSSADDIGDQFSPGNTNAVTLESSHSHQRQLVGVTADGVKAQGVSQTIIDSADPETTKTTSVSAISNNQKENWGN